MEFDSDNLYASGRDDAATRIQTFYEKQWLARGKNIRLISFRLPMDGELNDPAEDDIPRDDYRSLPRGVIQQTTVLQPE